MSFEDFTVRLLARIQAEDETWHAFVRTYDEGAVDAARRADERLASRQAPRALEGVTVAIKDIFDVAGDVTAVGSNSFAATPAVSDSEVVGLLRGAGALVVGKTRLTELAGDGWGLNRLAATPRNPSDMVVQRIPGGSSSGSAVAVAAGLVAASIGSDTGGSARIPASFCGVVGWKPPLGHISRRGMTVLSQSLDSVGIMAADTAMAKRLYSALSGEGNAGTVGRRAEVGLLGRRQWTGLAPDVEQLLSHAIEICRSLGYSISEAAPPQTFDDYRALTGELADAEAFRTVGWLAEDPAADIDLELRRQILSGGKVSDAGLMELRARQAAARIDFLRQAGDCDVWLTPVTVMVAPAVDAVPPTNRPVLSKFTRLANYLDLGALSLPIGWNGEGLPAAIQLIARPGGEHLLLDLASELETALAAQPR